jgi:DNA polymerase-3 subunit delta'
MPAFGRWLNPVSIWGRNEMDEIDVNTGPRVTQNLVGHGDAEAVFLKAYNSDRLHHAWLISGAKGVGKATFAYKIAKFLLTQPVDDGGGMFGDTIPMDKPTSLDADPDNPAVQRITAGGHGNIMLVERPWDEKKGVHKTVTTVDEVRKLINFFNKTASEAGWRIAIIDTVEDMNRNAANALLKVLEEPPEKSILLLVTNAPGKLLPTIRSRCQKITLNDLKHQDVLSVISARHPDVDELTLSKLAKLSDGAPGKALTLYEQGGIELYEKMVGILKSAPNIPSSTKHALAAELSRKGKEANWRQFIGFLMDMVAHIVRSSASKTPLNEVAGGEGTLVQKFMDANSADYWIDVWENMGQTYRAAEGVNLDKTQVILNMLHLIETGLKKPR